MVYINHWNKHIKQYSMEMNLKETRTLDNNLQLHQRGLKNLKKAMQTGLNHLMNDGPIIARRTFIVNEYTTTLSDYLIRNNEKFRNIYIYKKWKRTPIAKRKR